MAGKEKVKNPSGGAASNKKELIVENVKSLVIAIVLVLIIRSSVIEAFKIPSGSMIPTLIVGDHIFVNKLAYGFKVPFSDFFTSKPVYLVEREMPKRGDVVVFKYPRDESFYYIKRVIGVPNDKIKIKDKVIYINDQPLERTPLNKPEIVQNIEGRQYDKNSLELYEEINPTTKDKHMILIDKNNLITENYGEITVPPETLFVMGDNRDFSNDSRFWGFVPYKNIRGKAMFVWMSFWVDFGDSFYTFNPRRIGTIIR